MTKTLDIKKPTKKGALPCHRCGGDGIWGAYTENGRKMGGGTCFRCHGNGIDPTDKTWVFPADWTEAQRDEFLAKKAEQNDARREKAQAKREAKAQADAVLRANATDRRAFANPNRYEGVCAKCRATVAAGEGVYFNGDVLCRMVAECQVAETLVATAPIETEWVDVLLDVNTHEWIPAKLVTTRFGVAWALLDATGGFTGQFVSAFPKRVATMANKGYVEAEGLYEVGKTGDGVAPLEVRVAGVTATC